MRVLCLLMGALLVAGLAGCSYHPARISPEPAVVIDDERHHDRDHRHHDHDRDHRHRDDRHHEHGRGGDFCPPGQAKKGRC